MQTSEDATARPRGRGCPLVLVVDDDPDHRLLMQRAFDEVEASIDTLVAEGKEDAVELLGQAWRGDPTAVPDLLVLDLDLDGASGLDVLDEVRAHEPTAEVPVVVCSSSTEPEAETASLARGADGFLAKPASYPDLRQAVGRLTDAWIADPSPR